jgi:hypothetical protein
VQRQKCSWDWRVQEVKQQIEVGFRNVLDPHVVNKLSPRDGFLCRINYMIELFAGGVLSSLVNSNRDIINKDNHQRKINSRTMLAKE